MSSEIERIQPSEVIARFNNGDFKLSGSGSIYPRPKTRREMVNVLQKGVGLSHYELVYILLFLSGSSMEETQSLTNSLFNEGDTGKQADPSSIVGRGFGLFRLSCNQLQLFRGHHVRQCVFTTDNGLNWTGIEGQRLITRSARSWVAHLYDGLSTSIIRDYKPVFFSYDIRRWSVYVPVGTSWSPHEGMVYRADSRSLDELETALYRTASALRTGDFIQERVEQPLPSMTVKRKAPDGEAEKQGREKRARVELSTGTEEES